MRLFRRKSAAVQSFYWQAKVVEIAELPFIGGALSSSA
jgi:hypothetical protein